MTDYLLGGILISIYLGVWVVIYFGRMIRDNLETIEFKLIQSDTAKEDSEAIVDTRARLRLLEEEVEEFRRIKELFK